QKSWESPPRLISQPPPPNADHGPQSFCTQSGRRYEACRSPTFEEPLGRNTLGKTATSSPTCCCVRKRYFAGRSTLPRAPPQGPAFREAVAGGTRGGALHMGPPAVIEVDARFAAGVCPCRGAVG